MTFRVKEIREMLGITQEELAKRSGLSRQTVMYLESDECKNTSTKTLLAIADALHVKVDRLFG